MVTMDSSEGECPQCGSDLERVRLGDRISTICPECQYLGGIDETRSDRDHDPA